MSTQEIKMALHESIENIDDSDFLHAMMQIIDRKYKIDESPKLSNWQIERLDEAANQIALGKSFNNRQADLLVEKWLKE